MPHVAIAMIPGRDNDTKLSLAKKVQSFLSQELSLDKKYISVSVEDIEKENWNNYMEGYPDSIMLVKPGDTAD